MLYNKTRIRVGMTFFILFSIPITLTHLFDILFVWCFHVIAGDNVAKQHRLLVCRMTLETRKRMITKAEPRIKWWKLKKEDCCEELREEIRRALGGKEELPDDWTTTANIVRDTARKVLGVSSKQRKEDKETWWWDTEEEIGEEEVGYTER